MLLFYAKRNTERPRIDPADTRLPIYKCSFTFADVLTAPGAVLERRFFGVARTHFKEIPYDVFVCGEIERFF